MNVFIFYPLLEQTIKDPRLRQHTLKLDPGDYTFQVKAFTSAGDGPESEITAKIDFTTNGQSKKFFFFVLYYNIFLKRGIVYNMN